jgi:ABC-2 type transport system ATP-binding protein
MTPIVEANGLTKRYGRGAKEVRALDGLDLVAEAGHVVALLGPNGAGKTTFVRSLATLVRPDAGTLRVEGIDVVRASRRVRRLIGLAGQYAAVEPTMSGRENLEMTASLFGLDAGASRRAADRVLAQLHLEEAADRLVRTYSGGMRRRLDLGASLVGAPRLLLLDEPTTGLDPRSRIELWEAIRALVADGTDVLLTTQYLDEADQLASDIVIVDHGRVIAQGTPAELKARTGRSVVEVRARRGDADAVAATLAVIGADAPQIDDATGRVTVTVDTGTAGLLETVRALDARGLTVDDVALRRPTLDEVFLHLTGRPADEPVLIPTPPAAPTAAHDRSELS